MRFPRSCRLRSRRQFLDVYARGRRVSCSSLTIFAIPNGLGYCRLGITVTKKIGGAVLRNRVKRVLREIYRRHRSNLTPHLDLVVNAHRSIPSQPTRELEQEFLTAFRRMARRFEP